MTDNTPAVRTEVAAIDEKGPFIYDALFEYRSVNEFDESKHTTVERRLPKTVRDLCFKVSAPAEGFAPERFRSNVVRIPAAILANALHKLDENRAALRHT